jgi:hypothetical protein
MKYEARHPVKVCVPHMRQFTMSDIIPVTKKLDSKEGTSAVYLALAEEAEKAVNAFNHAYILAQESRAAAQSLKNLPVEEVKNKIKSDEETLKKNSSLAFERYAGWMILATEDPNNELISVVEKYRYPSGKDILIAIALNGQSKQVVKTYVEKYKNLIVEIPLNPAVDNIDETVREIVIWDFLEREALNNPLFEQIKDELMLFYEQALDGRTGEKTVKFNQEYLDLATAEKKKIDEIENKQKQLILAVQVIHKIKSVPTSFAQAHATACVADLTKQKKQLFRKFLAYVVLAINDPTGGLLNADPEKKYLVEVAMNGSVEKVVENYHTFYEKLMVDAKSPEVAEKARAMILEAFMQAEAEARPVVDKMVVNAEILLQKHIRSD